MPEFYALYFFHLTKEEKQVILLKKKKKNYQRELRVKFKCQIFAWGEGFVP